ncbi:MAG: OsmC family protein [Calditrichaceae bacterium]
MAKAKAKAIQIKGVTFMGITDSNHWVPMDGPVDFKGSDAGIRPKELLLLSLAGCTGSDVVAILDKMREPYTRFEVDIDADQTEEHPKVYSRIEVIYKIWGEGLKEANLQKAINLSKDRYCGVSAMLKDAVDIIHTYKINPEE